MHCSYAGMALSLPPVLLSWRLGATLRAGSRMDCCQPCSPWRLQRERQGDTRLTSCQRTAASPIKCMPAMRERVSQPRWDKVCQHAVQHAVLASEENRGDEADLMGKLMLLGVGRLRERGGGGSRRQRRSSAVKTATLQHLGLYPTHQQGPHAELHNPDRA